VKTSAEIEARLIRLTARWEAADGLGPLPGAWAAERALLRDQLDVARRAVTIATEAVVQREDAAALRYMDRVVAGAVPEPDVPGVTDVLLDDLAETGRPVPAMNEAERAAIEAVAGDPAAFAGALSRVRERIRADVLRYRLLFDLDRLSGKLPSSVAEDLARQAEACGDGSDASADLLALSEKMLAALAG